MDFKISSKSFENNQDIPIQYTCEDADISPERNWSNIPNGTKSLALIVDDPDAPDPNDPKMTWVHWVLYNLPTSVNNLEEGVSVEELPENTLEGTNDWKKPGYGGPCPPIGTHRYFHKLYALDAVLPNLELPTKDKLLKAMEGHIIGESQIVGLYKKQKAE